MYDVIIIGSGPAGLAAAIYAKRAALETLVLEKTPLSGGQIINTYEVDNYPGLPGISGMELGQKMRGHVDAEEAEVKTATVTAIEDKQDHKVVHTNQGDFETRTVVLAIDSWEFPERKIFAVWAYLTVQPAMGLSLRTGM